MNDRTNGAPDPLGADPTHAPEAPAESDGTGTHPASGSRFGIRRPRTRAEERIAQLDTSPAALTAELDGLRARAEAAEQEAAETKAAWQRTAADFQNYRRRTEQERADLALLGSETLLRKVLAVADDLDRALAHAPAEPSAAGWVEGVAAIDRKLRQLLESEGVRPIEALGKPFDPYQHDAIIHEPTTDAPDGTVVKELQRGYQVNGRVLRPALVAVADNTTSTGAGSAPSSEDHH